MAILDELDQDFQNHHRHVWYKSSYDPWNSEKPHMPQQRFHESTARVRAVISGRGGGKSVSGAAESVRYLLDNPGCKMLIAAPTFPMMETSTKVEFFRLLPEDEVKNYSRGRNELVMKNGSIVWFRSLEDPDRSVRGQTVSCVWIDEAAYVTEYAWKVIVACVRDPNYPHKIWITTTPKGFNWIYDRIVKKLQEDPDNKDYWYIQFKTTDNPWLTEETLEFLRSEFGAGEWGRQELGGEFLALSGTIYKEFSEHVHVGDYRGQQYEQIIYGVDWGFGESPFVLLTIGVDGNDRLHIIDEDITKGLSTDGIEALIKSAYDRYGVGPVYCDPAEPKSIEDLQRHGVRAYKADNSVLPGIKKVAARLESVGDAGPRLYVDQRCVQMINDLKMYHWKENKAGTVIKEEPAKDGPDHCCDALRYAIMEHDYSQRGRSNVLIENEDLDALI